MPVRRLREGIAEIIKSAASRCNALETAERAERRKDLLEHAVPIITATLEIKRKVVEEDVFDQGNRLILNFGHTIGHAIENTAGYGVVSHGEGVAIGMVAITSHAENRLVSNWIDSCFRKDTSKFHLPITYDLSHPDELFHAITHDKKAEEAN